MVAFKAGDLVRCREDPTRTVNLVRRVEHGEWKGWEVVVIIHRNPAKIGTRLFLLDRTIKRWILVETTHEPLGDGDAQT